MLSDEKMQLLADAFQGRVNDANRKIYKIIGDKLDKIGKLSRNDLYMITNTIKYGDDLEKINKILNELTNKNIEEIDKAFYSVCKNNYDLSEKYYKAKEINYVPLKENEPLKQLVIGIANTTKNTMANLSNTSALFIKDINGNIINFDTYYKNAIDNAITNAVRGTESYNKAINDTIREIGNSGFRVQYESGYTKRLDSAVRQSVLDGVHQVNQETQNEIGQQFGADGVEISAHALCAMDHLDIQGQQYSLEEFEELQATLDRPIGEYNCGHFCYNIVLGVDKPIYDKKTLREYKKGSNEKVEIEGKQYTRYEATQLQRRIETQIRYCKDNILLSKDKNYIDEQKAKIKTLSNKYNKVNKIARLDSRIERARNVFYR